MIELELTLSEWLYNSVLGQEVLSINHNYFRLRKPIERRIYEIARKHCGLQKKWHIGIKNLHKKVGSTSSIGKFKLTLRHIIKHAHLPDYEINLELDNVIFRYTGSYQENTEHNNLHGHEKKIHLKPETIEKAKRILQHKYDVYAVEYEWNKWWRESGEQKLKSPDGAFINFCKSRMENQYQQTELF